MTTVRSSLRPSITLLGKPRPAFQVCGYTGLLLAFVQSCILVAHLGLSELTLVGMTGVVILTFFSLTMITKLIAGDDLRDHRETEECQDHDSGHSNQRQFREPQVSHEDA